MKLYFTLAVLYFYIQYRFFNFVFKGKLGYKQTRIDFVTIAPGFSV